MKSLKRKFAVFNLAMMALVQVTIAYQSFHAFSHKIFTEQQTSAAAKKENKTTIAAAHVHEDCKVCDFHFDFFTAPQQFCLKLDFHFKQIPYTFSSKEGSAFFAGSLFALRAPPVFIA